MNGDVYRCPNCGKFSVRLNSLGGVWECGGCGKTWVAEDEFKIVVQRFQLRALAEELLENAEEEEEKALEWSLGGHRENAHICKVRAIAYLYTCRRIREILGDDDDLP